VVAVTDAFCPAHLDMESADLCRAVVGKLGRKRPSPTTRGDLRIWAAAVVYADVPHFSLSVRPPTATGGDREFGVCRL